MSVGTDEAAPCAHPGSKDRRINLHWIGEVGKPWDVMYGYTLSQEDHCFTIRRALGSLILGKRFRIRAMLDHPNLPAEARFCTLIECMHWAEVYWRSYKGKSKEYEIGHPLTWGDS